MVKPAAKPAQSTRKRKRHLPSPEEDVTPASSEPSVNGDTPERRPKRSRADKEAPAEVVPSTRPSRNKSKPQRYLEPPSPESREADPETTPSAKKAETPKSDGLQPKAPTQQPKVPTQKTKVLTEHSKVSTKQPKAPTGSNTIIIGAGIIGLFIALELAEKADGTTDYITVFDINKGPSKLASGHCAGFIYSLGLDEQLQALVEASSPLWDNLIVDERFCKDTKSHEKVMSLALYESSSNNEHISWIREDAGISCVRDNGVKYRLNPMRVGESLHERCERMGVKFYFGALPTNVAQNRTTGKIAGLRVQLADSSRPGPELFPFSNMVIAAGPFTPNILSGLFPERRLALDNHAHIYQSIQIQGVEISKASNIGATLALPHDKWFHGPAKITAEGATNKINISRCYNAVPEYTLTDEDAVRKRLGRSEELRHLAAEVLHLPGTDLKGKENISGQRVSLVSTGNEKNPVIGKVPSWLVGGKSGGKKGEDGPGVNVWLAYGFGNYGTTLAPAVGRLVGQMMRGEETVVDTYDFAVTELEIKAEPEVLSVPKKVGKGKGRATR